MTIIEAHFNRILFALDQRRCVEFKALTDARESLTALREHCAFSDSRITELTSELYEEHRARLAEVAALRQRISSLEEAARELVSAMETCHHCKSAVLVDEGPTYCQDSCGYDCEDHEEPACVPTDQLHARLKAILAASPSTPPPSAEPPQTGSPVSPSRSDGSERQSGFRSIYVASKVKHAGMWRQLRANGLRINSTWIDEAGEGESSDLSDLAMRCIDEARSARALVLYCEPGEVLKGALFEAGAALACGVPVFCVGRCASLSKTFGVHPLWRECASIEEAVAAALPIHATVQDDAPPTKGLPVSGDAPTKEPK